MCNAISVLDYFIPTMRLIFLKVEVTPSERFSSGEQVTSKSTLEQERISSRQHVVLLNMSDILISSNSYGS